MRCAMLLQSLTAGSSAHLDSAIPRYAIRRSATVKAGRSNIAALAPAAEIQRTEPSQSRPRLSIARDRIEEARADNARDLAAKKALALQRAGVLHKLLVATVRDDAEPANVRALHEFIDDAVIKVASARIVQLRSRLSDVT
jgi:hypothetical protein